MEMNPGHLVKRIGFLMPTARYSRPHSWLMVTLPLLGMMVSGCNRDVEQKSEAVSSSSAVQVDVHCGPALQAGFQRELLAYETEFDIHGSWGSDSAAGGWVIAGLKKAMPHPKWIASCDLNSAGFRIESAEDFQDSILKLIARHDWVVQRSRKKLVGHHSVAYDEVLSKYKRLDSLCQADPAGYWNEDMIGPSWIAYQLWGYDNFLHSPRQPGMVLPAILRGDNPNILMDLFIQYRLELRSDSISLFRTIMNLGVVGDQELTW
jgi:hypothetical protein